MQIRPAVFILLLSLLACGEPSRTSPPVKEEPRHTDAPQPEQGGNPYHAISEIPLPAGYSRVPAAEGSFAAWLRNLPLKEDKTVYLFNGQRKGNQEAQFAVVDMATGSSDLQQCADVVMRLRAEYLFSTKQFNEIAFMDYGGKWYRWQGGANRPGFDNYLKQVFGWCGSASLEKQLKPVNNFLDMKPGDVLVKGGFPGHAVTVVDMAVNNEGKKVYLLVQGYQPAQDMHVLINPSDAALSPWYLLEEQPEIITPEWRFVPQQLATWP